MPHALNSTRTPDRQAYRYMNTLVNERKHKHFKMIANSSAVSNQFDLLILKRMYLEQVRELGELSSPMLATLTTGTTRQPIPTVVEHSYYGPTYSRHAYCSRS